ncbi:50S ribosomal protein L3 N(5)-glutamine methyltransferase [Acidovorax sp. sic0104]|uniref:50S ribosomal protein L3 N(5)-glutamine methyltransferase n=1 Tax=Acidovorax sp. sic0104 TaxID=2854784 RepID=UPI001C453C0B|nr:50S ribosomal protein L3 N(5)-glutamine methyltransferase [Acidovorax sp. sic0104]MBV7540330.1 50S ribosomal protein L3 N(5)-glutamine methyltransferase [Acidovorax sp. sic0104]
MTRGSGGASSESGARVSGSTVGELVESGSQLLTAASVAFGHGTTNSHDEAAWLVLWRLGMPLGTDLSDAPGSARNQPVTPDESARVAALFEERIRSRKPAAYLTQEAWLQGVPFYVDERAIVPRSFIAELLADGSVDDFLSDNTRRVLDLCTGNGSLAVLAAMAWPEVQVTGADISPDALAVARINVDRHGLQERIALQLSDGLGALPGPWDLILCNPPYVNAASMQALPDEYRAEPELALAGGDDGMDFVRQLFAAAPSCMSEEAVIILEIGNERAHFEAAFPDLPVFWLPTSAGEDQVLLVSATALHNRSGALKNL